MVSESIKDERLWIKQYANVWVNFRKISPNQSERGLFERSPKKRKLEWSPCLRLFKSFKKTSDTKPLPRKTRGQKTTLGIVRKPWTKNKRNERVADEPAMVLPSKT